MKAGLSLNVFLQGISKPLLRVDSALMFKRLYCALILFGLAFFLEILFLVGASLSEPHIDEFAVNFLYIYIYIYLSYVVP